MPSLSEAIKALKPEAVFSLAGPNNVIVVATPSGDVISFWNPAIGAQPTQTQLDAVTQVQVDAANDAREAATNPDRRNLRLAAAGAIVDIDTYLAIATPTNAQVAAIVRKSAQVQKQLIKYVLEKERP